MSLKLNSSGGGSITLQEPTTASNVTLNLPAADGTVVFENSSGNVGIGTSSTAANNRITLNASSGNNGLEIQNSGDSNRGGRLVATGSAASGTFAVNTTSSGYALTFGIDGSERARITSGGDFYVRTITGLSPGGVGGISNLRNPNNDGSWALAVQNDGTSATTGRGLGIRNATDFNTASSEFIYCVGNATARFFVQSNGGIYNYSANNVNLSDRREKTNFAPAGEYLSKICAIPVQTFNYIDQNMEDDPGTTLGVIAQDVQAVAPELVTESNWGAPEEPKMRLSIYQTDLQYALMKCIQEQQQMIETLQAKVAALEAQ